MDFAGYRTEIIPDTEFRLDGGAMFGVVPRVLWERVCPPDELNRIRMNMNCLFIDTGSEKILIETGIGEKWSEKESKMYGIFREKPLAETLFENNGLASRRHHYRHQHPPPLRPRRRKYDFASGMDGACQDAEKRSGKQPSSDTDTMS